MKTAEAILKEYYFKAAPDFTEDKWNEGMKDNEIKKFMDIHTEAMRTYLEQAIDRCAEKLWQKKLEAEASINNPPADSHEGYKDRALGRSWGLSDAIELLSNYKSELK